MLCEPIFRNGLRKRVAIQRSIIIFKTTILQVISRNMEIGFILVVHVEKIRNCSLLPHWAMRWEVNTSFMHYFEFGPAYLSNLYRYLYEILPPTTRIVILSYVKVWTNSEILWVRAFYFFGRILKSAISTV